MPLHLMRGVNKAPRCMQLGEGGLVENHSIIIQGFETRCQSPKSGSHSGGGTPTTRAPSPCLIKAV
eukprot:6189100-Pyramimonas_sp.AAC.1